MPGRKIKLLPAKTTFTITDKIPFAGYDQEISLALAGMKACGDGWINPYTLKPILVIRLHSKHHLRE